MNKVTFRAMVRNDIQHVKSVIDSNELFPSEMLDEMVISYFDNSSEDKWFVAEIESGKAIAVAYCSPERMTDNTWNLLLIAVNKADHGSGIGKAFITFIKDQLTSLQARILIVETSGLSEFSATQQFYVKCGFSKVATIPEFYAEGDDKIVFWAPVNKHLKS